MLPDTTLPLISGGLGQPVLGGRVVQQLSIVTNIQVTKMATSGIITLSFRGMEAAV
jgi:hypothetical protein